MRSTQARRITNPEFNTPKRGGQIRPVLLVKSNAARPAVVDAPPKEDPIDTLARYRKEAERERQSRNRDGKKSVTLRMVVDIIFDYNPHNVTRFELEQAMTEVVKGGVDKGLFTASMDANIDKWFTRTEELR